jgi:cytochrome c oxidase cbb3-type subunit 3
MTSTEHHTPGKILRFEEYQREHPPAPETPPAAASQTAEDEQARYRSFSPDYYAGIQAGMNRMRGIGSAAMPVAAAVPPGATTEAVAAAPDPQAQMVGAVPTDELLDHNYDGIQEYDNPTPGWWYAVFVATIMFSGLYLLVYHLAVPPLSVRHATAEARHLDQQFAELNQLENGEPKILAIMNEEAWLSRGEAIFTSACAQCHSADGSGLIGPNLTDDTYKNITGLMDIADLIVTGSANGAMPSQKNILNDNEIALVSAWVASLRGKGLPTNPMVSPEYEGVPIDPWPTLNAAGQVVPGQPGQQPAEPAGDEISRAGD